MEFPSERCWEPHSGHCGTCVSPPPHPTSPTHSSRTNWRLRECFSEPISMNLMLKRKYAHPDLLFHLKLAPNWMELLAIYSLRLQGAGLGQHQIVENDSLRKGRHISGQNISQRRSVLYAAERNTGSTQTTTTNSQPCRVLAAATPCCKLTAFSGLLRSAGAPPGTSGTPSPGGK